MNVKQFAVEMAPAVVAVNTPEQAGEVLAKILNATGPDVRAISLTLAHLESELPFDEALGLWRVVEDMVPGVERMLGIKIKHDLWFEGIEWEIGTDVPRV